MTTFRKIIVISIISLLGLFVLGLYKYNTMYQDVTNDNKLVNDEWYKDNSEDNIDDKKSDDLDTRDDENINKKEPIDKRSEIIKNSDRINIVAMGISINNLADTIMVISIDLSNKSFDIISIPRDTYYYVEGHESGGNRKINATYGRNRENGMLNGVRDILGIPIHHYLSIRYKGVEELVDEIGGVSVNVPFHMKYEDITDTPPLYIDIPKGYQTLDGETAVKYLRYRHGNERDENGEFIEGYKSQDLGRIKAQQKFIVSGVKQSLNFNIINIVKKAFKVINTDMNLDEAIVYTKEFGKIDTDKIYTYNLPGIPKNLRINNQTVSYFLSNKDKIEKLVDDIYEIDLGN